MLALVASQPTLRLQAGSASKNRGHGGEARSFTPKFSSAAKVTSQRHDGSFLTFCSLSALNPPSPPLIFTSPTGEKRCGSCAPVPVLSSGLGSAAQAAAVPLTTNASGTVNRAARGRSSAPLTRALSRSLSISQLIALS